MFAPLGDVHLHVWGDAEPQVPVRDGDRPEPVAERISQTKPDLPSIAVPLEHEPTITATSGRREPVAGPRRPIAQPSDRDVAEVGERTSINEETALNGVIEGDTRHASATRPSHTKAGLIRELPATSITTRAGGDGHVRIRWR
jgi:hypothetical protein